MNGEHKILPTIITYGGIFKSNYCGQDLNNFKNASIGNYCGQDLNNFKNASIGNYCGQDFVFTMDREYFNFLED
jgi:hypothetical protein